MSDAQTPLSEKGARNSRADLSLIQEMHDRACALGAACKHAEPDGDEVAESASPQTEWLTLTESACATEEIELRESARSEYEIKLIAAGKGASAFYPPDVLKRDGPDAFPADTKIYLNHPTKNQESEGPGNRDVNRFAAVTTAPAQWMESHPKGPGLYTNIKVFADYAPALAEKAKHLAMSIYANGAQAVEAGKKVYREGVPLLSALAKGGPLSGHSVDIVPIPGAGGMILAESGVPIQLTESARPADNQVQESQMDETAVQKLVESAVAQAISAMQTTTVAPLLERALRGDAREEATRILQGVSLQEATKQEVIADSLRESLPMKDGQLDRDAFTARVNESAKRFGALEAKLTGAGQVRGMGTVATQESAEQIAARESSDKQMREMAEASFARIMGRTPTQGRAN